MLVLFTLPLNVKYVADWGMTTTARSRLESG
jgi:hypothetical protein